MAKHGCPFTLEWVGYVKSVLKLISFVFASILLKSMCGTKVTEYSIILIVGQTTFKYLQLTPESLQIYLFDSAYWTSSTPFPDFTFVWKALVHNYGSNWNRDIFATWLSFLSAFVQIIDSTKSELTSQVICIFDSDLFLSVQFKLIDFDVCVIAAEPCDKYECIIM